MDFFARNRSQSKAPESTDECHKENYVDDSREKKIHFFRESLGDFMEETSSFFPLRHPIDFPLRFSFSLSVSRFLSHTNTTFSSFSLSHRRTFH